MTMPAYKPKKTPIGGGVTGGMRPPGFPMGGARRSGFNLLDFLGDDAPGMGQQGFAAGEPRMGGMGRFAPMRFGFEPGILNYLGRLGRF